MTKSYRLFNPRCPTRSRARVRLCLCVIIMGANVELMNSASSAATSSAAPVEMTTAASDFFYHTDDLYNVMAITDDTGAVADAGNERYEYADYGQPVDIFTIDPIAGNPSAIGNPYNFTGRRYDSETGWYYYRTRYQDPVAGRFTTRDGIGTWGDRANFGNAYTYVGNNPLTYQDPLGQGKCVYRCHLFNTATVYVLCITCPLSCPNDKVTMECCKDDSDCDNWPKSERKACSDSGSDPPDCYTFWTGHCQ